MSFFQLVNGILSKRNPQQPREAPQPPARKRYTGMSKRPTITQEVKDQPNGGTAAKGKIPGLLQDAGIYIQIIKGDIKGVFRVDEESKKKKEIHDDFMEHHFGVKKK